MMTNKLHEQMNKWHQSKGKKFYKKIEITLIKVKIKKGNSLIIFFYRRRGGNNKKGKNH